MGSPFGVTLHRLQSVLEGDIDGFVDALMAKERSEQLGGSDGDGSDGSEG